MRIILTALLLTFMATVHAEIYHWVDKNGVTHYSQLPPEEVDADFYEPPKDNVFNAPKAAKDNQMDAEQSPTAKVDEKKPAVDCNMVKNVLETLKTRPRIRETKPDGSVVILPDEVKQQRLEQTQKVYDEQCAGK